MNEKLKLKIRTEARSRGLTMTGYLLSCRSFFLKLETLKVSNRDQSHERPWEFNEPHKKTSSGRVLPLIPGTPAYKKAQFHINKVSLITELKDKLKRISELASNTNK